MDIFIGIDGGGTRTTALATDAQGRELAREEGEAGIVNVLHPAAGAESLSRLVRRVAELAGADTPVAGLCCALAGAGREPERLGLERALGELGIAERVRVTTDAEGALADALGAGPGILLIAGTGSIAWGRDAAGRTARTGGWGQLLGDEGSGYSIGLAALRAAVRGHDGRGPSTGLERAVLQATELKGIEALLAWATAASKGAIGGLAPIVFEAADVEDEVALGILAAAADGLVEHVAALHRRLAPWTDPPLVALSGGLIAPGGPLRPWLERALRVLPVRISPAPVDPARGAAALARALDA